MSEDTKHQYWYNMRTAAVEQGMQSPSADRVGPFVTRAEAENALEKLRANSAKWAAEEAENDR
ncbi:MULTISPECIES: SPOR domain-containing protein [Cryobacterium]|uniref:SPOR domain-containing protein n=1 Tax=Cryobacterium breve TaxID=1259258 RepID=A0ABY2J1D4_9MICO|nr:MULTISPECIES: SPOR domain-containing protein [Cryobacterium]TFC96855.1 SPOR domain-containing protein [Cryobacterium sp. TmT3-12]TFC97349.1 SPOR domain-containing protein [Cryobacterium breve]